MNLTVTIGTELTNLFFPLNHLGLVRPVQHHLFWHRRIFYLCVRVDELDHGYEHLHSIGVVGLGAYRHDLGS